MRYNVLIFHFGCPRGCFALFLAMFIRKKPNKSGKISVQVIDKSTGKYKVIRSLGSSSDSTEVERLESLAKEFIKEKSGQIEIDFINKRQLYQNILSSISEHKLAGIDMVLGKLFNEIGFNKIEDDLFKDLVLYRLVYPKSKLRTVEYLKRYALKNYSEDEIYRYMDKLHAIHKEQVQNISYEHTKFIFNGEIQAVFYDVTTLYFEIDKEDDLRKNGFSKDGKHQHPQILLGLLVSRGAYPLAYDIFEGNKFEGETIIPIIDAFAKRYGIDHITIIADAGLLSKRNVVELQQRGFNFILGARLKNEKDEIKSKIIEHSFIKGEPLIIEKNELTLIVTQSEERAIKDEYNRKKGLKRLEKTIKSGKMTKSNINNKGYNKFLKLDGELKASIDEEKIKADEKWDGLKGYLTNSKMAAKEVLENYSQLWEIEKAFRVAKSELKIRPVFHYRQRRIEAHICLNFVAYKIYKELERQLREKKSKLSPEKVIEIIQSIYEIKVITPEKEVIKQLIITTEEQNEVKKLFLS